MRFIRFININILFYQTFRETGDKLTLQKWSRGVCMAIRGGGFIESWSPVQVALIMIAFFCMVLPDVPVVEWASVVLSYDNICNIDR